MPAAFAHELAKRAGTSEIEHPVIDESVLKNGIRLAQRMHGVKREQTRISWTGAGQPDCPGFEDRKGNREPHRTLASPGARNR